MSANNKSAESATCNSQITHIIPTVPHQASARLDPGPDLDDSTPASCVHVRLGDSGDRFFRLCGGNTSDKSGLLQPGRGAVLRGGAVVKPAHLLVLLYK